MVGKLLTLAITYSIASGLALFGLRRLLFSAAALFASLTRKGSNSPSGFIPMVTLLIPARDEESTIARTLEAVARLDFPPDRLEVVMIDDCSGDRTSEIMKVFAGLHPNFRYHRVGGRHNLGKAAALNEAVRAFGRGEIIYVLDADSIPEPGCVRLAVRHFADDIVGAVTGAPFPSENCATLASYYAYLETLVHQSVTTRAKDVLGLAPAIFGSNCAYRRLALERIGGFKDGALLEDSDLVLALSLEGYAIRFEPRAITKLAMPRTVSSYFRQHARWTRGFNDVIGGRGLEILTRRQLSPALRAELFLFSFGYLDRVLILAGLAMVIGDLLRRNVFGFPKWVLAGSLLSPVLTISSALVICREPLSRHWRLPLVPLFFAIDVVATFKGVLDSVVNRSRKWHRVDRMALPDTVLETEAASARAAEGDLVDVA